MCTGTVGLEGMKNNCRTSAYGYKQTFQRVPNYVRSWAVSSHPNTFVSVVGPFIFVLLPFVQPFPCGQEI